MIQEGDGLNADSSENTGSKALGIKAQVGGGGRREGRGVGGGSVFAGRCGA